MLFPHQVGWYLLNFDLCHTPPMSEIGNMGAFFGAYVLLPLPKQMLFLTISNENIFCQNSQDYIGAIVAPNEGLKKASQTEFNSSK